MPTMKIQGWGKWLLLTELEESIAKKYAENVFISQSENDDLESESESASFGFDAESLVTVDDKEIGTVIDVIEKSKGTERYDDILKSMKISEIANIQNAWIKEETYKGTFAEVEIEDDCVDENGVTKKFYERFIENIEVVDAFLFHFSEWGEEEVDDDGVHGKSAEVFVICNGEVFSLEIQDND